MHLVKDENGNLCSHGHEHSHEHHAETECGGCTAGCGGHSHEQEHGHKAFETPEQMAALLDYMLKHNQSHAAELDQLAAKLQTAGRGDAAEQIKKAVDEFQKGNLYLSLALSMVKEG